MKTKRINLIKGYFRNASNTLSIVMEFDIEIFTLHKDYKKNGGRNYENRHVSCFVYIFVIFFFR